MIPVFVKNRRGDTFINQLSYFIKGGVIAPYEAQNPIDIAAAVSATLANSPVQALMESALEACTELFSNIAEFDALLTGTLTGTSGSANITGTGTRFLTELAANDQIILDPFGASPVTVTVSSVTTNGAMALTAPLAADYTGVIARLVTNYDTVVNAGRVEITDLANRRKFMNGPIHIGHVFGVVGRPFYLPESIILRAQQPLQFDFFNLSQLGRLRMRFCSEMRKFQQNALRNADVTNWLAEQMGRKRHLFPYWLKVDASASTDPIVIPAGGTRDIFFTPDRNLELVLFQGMEYSYSAGQSGNTTEKYLVEFFDPGTERPLQNQPVARSAAFGTGYYPFNLVTGLLFEANTKMRVRLTNLVTDAATNVVLTFHGVGRSIDLH